MTDAEQPTGGTDLPVLTRAALWAQVAARRAGTLSNAALAAWAFAQFYDEDMEELLFDPDDDDEIRDVLDTLMFADDAAFALDDAALDALLQRLAP